MNTIISGMNVNEYRALDRMNASSLKYMNLSPLHFLENKKNPQKETQAMRLGTMVHTAILEPDLFVSNYIVQPSDLKKPTAAQLNAKKPSEDSIRQIEAWQAFENESNGRTIIDFDEYETAMAMHNSVRENQLASKVLSKGKSEETLLFNFQGIDCKARLDWFCGDRQIIVDLKTTEAKTSKEFCDSIFSPKYLYVMQAAFYHDAILEITGSEPDFVFISVEKTPPYSVGVYQLSKEVIEHGRNIYKTLLEKYIMCKESNDWSSNNEIINYVELPQYLRPKEIML